MNDMLVYSVWDQSWITRDLGRLLTLFLKEFNCGETNPSTPLSNCIILCIDSPKCWCSSTQPCDLSGLESVIFSSVNICEHLPRNFIKTGNVWNDEWEIVALGPSLPQFQRFRLHSHLWDLLEGPPIFEMGIQWSNAFRIGYFWVLKPTFPRLCVA
jgi:hypothetical protein